MRKTFPKKDVILSLAYFFLTPHIRKIRKITVYEDTEVFVEVDVRVVGEGPIHPHLIESSTAMNHHLSHCTAG